MKLTDSCIKQLLSITHGTYEKLDKKFKVRDVFLDIFKLKYNGISGKLLRLIKDCISGRKQRVTFNGQCSFWMDLQQEFLKALCLDLYFFLIYTNDLSDNLTLNSKLFAGDTSLFSILTDPNAPASHINNDFHNTNTWAYQWKMNFKPDTSKQALEIKFSSKIMVIAHPRLIYNNNPVHETSSQRHLAMF